MKDNERKERELANNGIMDLLSELRQSDFGSRGFASAPHVGVDDIHDAFLAAADVHDGQHRFANKVKIPYILHPISVAEYVVNVTDDSEAVIVALLHDTVEDGARKIAPGLPVSEAKDKALTIYERAYGKRVAEAVGLLTNPEVEKSLSKQEKRREYQQHVRDAITAWDNDPIVFIVKFADFLDNAGRIDVNAAQRARHFYAKYQPLVRSFYSALSRYRRVAPEAAYYARIERDLSRIDKQLQKAHEVLF